MTRLFAIAAFLIALAALGLSLFHHLNPPRWKHDFGAATPAGVVPAMMSILTDDIRLQAMHAHKGVHRDEILETLKITSTSISGDYAIVFFQYSIGDETFRDAHWVARVVDKWYWMPNLEYALMDSDKMDWIDEQRDRKEEWKSRSAKSKYE